MCSLNSDHCRKWQVITNTPTEEEMPTIDIQNSLNIRNYLPNVAVVYRRKKKNI